MPKPKYVRKQSRRKIPPARKPEARLVASSEKLRHHDEVVLTPVGQWLAQMRRLQEWYARVEKAPSMQGETWRSGQLRYINGLITQHLANKPAEA